MREWKETSASYKRGQRDGALILALGLALALAAIWFVCWLVK
jgi:hypothetical protein